MWIRSQDKEQLVKCDNIVVKCKNAQIPLTDINRNKSREEIILENSKSLLTNDILLGTYKTHERALDILDEITNQMHTNNLIEITRNIRVDSALHYLTVYEMPKE